MYFVKDNNTLKHREKGKGSSTQTHAMLVCMYEALTIDAIDTIALQSAFLCSTFFLFSFAFSHKQQVNYCC